MEAAELWERESAAAALAGLQVCPQFRVPCWICEVLSLLQRTVQVVTTGGDDLSVFVRIFAHPVSAAWAADPHGTWAALVRLPVMVCTHARSAP